MIGWRVVGSLCAGLLLLGSVAGAQEPQDPKRAKPGEDEPAVKVTRPRQVSRPAGGRRLTRPPPGRERVSRIERGRPLVEFEITCEDEDWGRIVVELYPERTPITVRNFLRYVDEGYYDGTIFHRVLPDFIIQGGGYTGLDEKQTGALHGAIRNESRQGLKNERGTIAMARKSSPHSALTQFFINLVDNPDLDYPIAGAYGYCAFGRVIAGMDVAERIKAIPTQVSPAAQRRFARYKEAGEEVEQAEKSQPIKPPMIKHARRLDRNEYEARRTARPGLEAVVPPEENMEDEVEPGVEPEEEPAEEPGDQPEEDDPGSEEPEPIDGSGLR